MGMRRGEAGEGEEGLIKICKGGEAEVEAAGERRRRSGKKAVRYMFAVVTIKWFGLPSRPSKK